MSSERYRMSGVVPLTSAVATSSPRSRSATGASPAGIEVLGQRVVLPVVQTVVLAALERGADVADVRVLEHRRTPTLHDRAPSR